MPTQPSPIVTLTPGGHGRCTVGWCTCKLWKGGKRGMSGLEVCVCGHLPQTHQGDHA